MKRVELLDCAPWEIRLLVLAIVRSEQARRLFRAIAPGPSILGDHPAAQTIVAHALRERPEVPQAVHVALDHRVAGHQTWREYLDNASPMREEWHLSDVRRCIKALGRKWLPIHLRWASEGVERGDWSRLNVVFDLAELLRDDPTGRVA